MPEEPQVPNDEGMLEKRTRDIEQDMMPKMKSDEDLIKDALSQVEDFAGAQNVTGEVALVRDFLKGYELIVDMGVEEKKAFVFVFPEINLDVLRFMMQTAKADNVNNILGYTQNAVVAEEYKPIRNA